MGIAHLQQKRFSCRYSYFYLWRAFSAKARGAIVGYSCNRWGRGKILVYVVVLETTIFQVQDSLGRYAVRGETKNSF